MLRLAHLLWLGPLAACSFDRAGGRAGAERPDSGSPGDPDGAVADGADAALDAEPGHLLLTEVVAVTGDAVAAELIELWNPSAETIDLATVYLCDDESYFRLPEAVATGVGLPIGATSDFLARFPAGATLGPGQVVVVALEQADFAEVYQRAPDFGLQAGDVPALDLIYGSAVPTITDSGEGVVLFRWDGAADLVTDLDLVLVGPSPSGSNRLGDKGGEQVDGPDGDDQPTAYRDEAAAILASQTATDAGEAYERIAREPGHEVDRGGNGAGGHDETSEDTRTTWRQSGYGPPTPGELPEGLAQR